MKKVLKVFIVWALLPYIVVFLIVPAAAFALGRNSALSTASYWRGQPFTLASCVLQAAVGIAILWIVPITRQVLGMIAGAIVATACVTTAAFVALHLLGGFEQRVDIMVSHMMLWVPSVVAGGYAGIVHAAQGNKRDIHSLA